MQSGQKRQIQTDCETTVELKERKTLYHAKDATAACRQILIICGQRSPW